ncbi:hypothetical protein LCGC14_3097290 [marine sediment metagenome]|uniref:Uncharacterized protein n=1 Tax=marine sediment metagenome TaxID=412755 RepID=A0A0F8WXL4_9ZZZZ
MKIEDWINENLLYNRDPLFIRQLKEEGLSEENIEKFLGVLNKICTDCWDESFGCQCNNDE